MPYTHANVHIAIAIRLSFQCPFDFLPFSSANSMSSSIPISFSSILWCAIFLQGTGSLTILIVIVIIPLFTGPAEEKKEKRSIIRTMSTTTWPFPVELSIGTGNSVLTIVTTRTACSMTSQFQVVIMRSHCLSASYFFIHPYECQ